MVGTIEIRNVFINGSALVDRFDLTYGLNDTQTKEVSDHFPIYITLDIPRPLLNNSLNSTNSNSTQVNGTSPNPINPNPTPNPNATNPNPSPIPQPSPNVTFPTPSPNATNGTTPKSPPRINHSFSIGIHLLVILFIIYIY